MFEKQQKEQETRVKIQKWDDRVVQWQQIDLAYIFKKKKWIKTRKIQQIAYRDLINVYCSNFQYLRKLLNIQKDSLIFMFQNNTTTTVLTMHFHK